MAVMKIAAYFFAFTLKFLCVNIRVQTERGKLWKK